MNTDKMEYQIMKPPSWCTFILLLLYYLLLNTWFVHTRILCIWRLKLDMAFLVQVRKVAKDKEKKQILWEVFCVDDWIVNSITTCINCNRGLYGADAIN